MRSRWMRSNNKLVSQGLPGSEQKIPIEKTLAERGCPDSMEVMSMNIKNLTFLIVVSLLALPVRAEILVKDGETIAFMGDSITQAGARNETGYVRRVDAGLAANGIQIKRIDAGISGHKSNQMLERLQKVLDKKPDWMTLSCGVNDVWHGDRGVNLEDYKKNITAIVEKCEEAGVKVVILTSTPIKEEKNDLNTKLEDYNAFLRELAGKKKLPLTDLNAMMWKEIENPDPTFPKAGKHYLTSDGVHMNPFGDAVMAEGVLRAFGLGDPEIEKAKTAWQDLKISLRVTVPIPMKQYRELAELAESEGKEVDAVVQQMLSDTLKETLN